MSELWFDVENNFATEGNLQLGHHSLVLSSSSSVLQFASALFKITAAYASAMAAVSVLNVTSRLYQIHRIECMRPKVVMVENVQGM